MITIYTDKAHTFAIDDRLRVLGLGDKPPEKGPKTKPAPIKLIVVGVHADSVTCEVEN